jgi:hypothetical protein
VTDWGYERVHNAPAGQRRAPGAVPLEIASQVLGQRVLEEWEPKERLASPK